MAIAVNGDCAPPFELSVLISIEQLWVSGVTLSLRDPDGTTAVLMARPGLDVGNYGLSSNLKGDHPLRFVASGNPLDLLKDCWPHDANVVCDPEGNSCNWDSPCSFAPEESLAIFSADPIAGSWQLCTGVDEAVGNYFATLYSVTIETAHD